MIAGVVRLLRPVFEPLLKLRMTPPHLPEGSSNVRHLKPSDEYLAYRYVIVGLVVVGKLSWAAAVSVALILALGKWGFVLSGILVVFCLGLGGLLLVAERLDWELCDYLLGDRSLRVRAGALVQREITLSFANVQNVEVAQGPLERAFGFKSLRVTTAGGTQAHGEAGGSSHEAVLVGLRDADEIRELMLRTMRAQRGGGLGDAEDARPHPGGDVAVLEEVLLAARELRAAAEGAERR